MADIDDEERRRILRKLRGMRIEIMLLLALNLTALLFGSATLTAITLGVDAIIWSMMLGETSRDIKAFVSLENNRGGPYAIDRAESGPKKRGGTAPPS